MNKIVNKKDYEECGRKIELLLTKAEIMGGVDFLNAEDNEELGNLSKLVYDYEDRYIFNSDN